MQNEPGGRPGRRDPLRRPGWAFRGRAASGFLRPFGPAGDIGEAGHRSMMGTILILAVYLLANLALPF